jgi:hypothetical protein
LTKEIHAVVLDPELRPAGQSARHMFQLAVIELDNQPAAIADQVMAVPLADPGVVAVPVVHVHVLHQLEPGE